MKKKDKWKNKAKCQRKKKIRLIELIQKNKRQNSGILRQGRLFGPSSQQINEVNKYPWVCSLRTFGFR